MAIPLVIPCCIKSLCPGDAPLQNLSAEQSDGPSFIAVNFGGWLIPPAGTTYRDPGQPCFTEGESEFAASSAAQRCVVIRSTDDPGGGGGDWRDPNGNPVNNFGNTSQTCVVACADGLPFAFTVPANTYRGTSQEQANNIAFSFACRQASLNKVCMSSLSKSGCLNQAYFDTIIPLGRSPFHWSIISGALPPGLTFTPGATVATVSGTPTTIGAYTFRVQVVDSRGNFMRKTFIIDVLSISNSAQAPTMTAGSPFSFQLIGVGGVVPYTFDSDDLPDGLSISSTGLISGTPTLGGPIDSIVTITDANSASCDFEITSVNCPFFDSLIWDAPFVVPAAPPPNSSGFTASAAGRSIEFNGFASMLVVGQPLVYDITANCTEGTPDEIECVVSINVKSQVGGGYGPSPGDHGGWFMEVQVFDNNAPFATFLDVKSGIDFGPGAAVYNFPVTITAGASVGIFIAINVGYPLPDFGPISGAIDVVVTFGS